MNSLVDRWTWKNNLLSTVPTAVHSAVRDRERSAFLLFRELFTRVYLDGTYILGGKVT